MSVIHFLIDIVGYPITGEHRRWGVVLRILGL